MKSIWSIFVACSLSLFSACEQSEPALMEETEHLDNQANQKADAQHKTGQYIGDNTGKVLKIEIGTPEREFDTVSVDTSNTNTNKIGTNNIGTSKIDVANNHSRPQEKPIPQSTTKPIKTTPFNVRRCMNMGNALEAPREGDWGYTITAQDLRTIAQAGFDTVRIPIRWDAHANHRAPYTIDASFMTRIKTVVREAQTAGLGVIIDVHHYENLMAHPAREQARFLAIWDQIARNFAKASDTVYFEVLNEPTLQLSSQQVNVLYAKALPIIRATNPSRKVILGGNSWNSIESLGAVRWPRFGGKTDPNLVATFHDYGPHEFTHQGAEWSNPVHPLGRHWGGRSDMAELADTYGTAKKFQARTGLPVFIGEFGVIEKVPVAERFAWTKTRRMTMEAHGFSWCSWDFAGVFKSYDKNTGRWLPGAQDAFFGR